MIPLGRLATRRSRWLAVLAFALVCLAALGATANPPTQPNIVLILLDDLGYGDLGAYGGSAIQTPNLDTFATQGMRFDQHYAMGPNCSPARVGLLTGRYPAALGVRDVIDTADSARGVPASIPMLSDVLRSAGYATAHVGKWHMGTEYDEYTPKTRFDHWVRSSGTGYFDPTIKVDDESFPSVGHRTALLTDYAIDFINDNAVGPFFLNVWYNAPHAPLEPPAHWAVQYPDTVSGRYGALVSAADEQIGRILSTLNSLGLDSQTLVLVSSDNGSGLGSNAPLRGFKEELYEGGIRVPLLARWTGSIPPGTVNDSLSAHFDFFPTLAEHLGIDVSGLDLHGESILAALLSDAELPRSAPLFWEYVQQFAVREGDWKLHQEVNATEPDPIYDPVLIDLNADLGETTDQSLAEPAIADSLLSAYAAWRWQMGPIDFEVAATEGAAVVVGDDMVFANGRVTLAANRQLNFSDGDFTFRASVSTTGIGSAQTLIELAGAWTMKIRADGRVEMALDRVDGGQTILTSPRALEANVDYDLAFTTWGSRWGDDTRRLYIDGLLEAQVVESDAVASSEASVYMGNDASSSTPLAGNISSPAFYSFSLTAREIGGDADSDAVDNVDDNCPLAANGPAEAGIPGLGDQTDSDGDGVGDACDDDDDDDGLLDVVESDTGVFVDPGDTGTDPRDSDSDADSFTDSNEVTAGSDPNSALSIPTWGTAYADAAAFAASFGDKGSVDFEAYAEASVLSGVTIDDIGGLGLGMTLPASVEDVLGPPSSTLDLRVVHDAGSQPTTSGVRSLGVSDSGAQYRIAAGTRIDFDFPSEISGFGLQLITDAEAGVELAGGDVELFLPSVGATALSLSDGVVLPGGGGQTFVAYFLGFRGDLNFDSAQLRYAPSVVDGSFAFVLDDITLVPEAEPLALWLAALPYLVWLKRARRPQS